MGILIEGLERDRNKKLYGAIEKEGNNYGIKRIKVKLVEKDFIIASYLSSIKVSGELPEILNENELNAAIAHEFSHISHRDLIRDILMALPFIILAVLQTIFAKIFVNEAFYMYLLILPILLALAYLVICISILYEIERRSDREGALKTTPQAMIGMLKKKKGYIKGFDLFSPAIDKRITWLKELETKQ
jgi:Zn-dependent protease with chaperone function